MSRLRILQAWIATAVLSTGVAVVPGMAAGSKVRTTLWSSATKPIPLKHLIKPRWTNSTSWLGNKQKSRAQPAEIPFQ
jgi:hypothetical protein